MNGANGPSAVPHAVADNDAAVADACMDQAVQVARITRLKLKSVAKSRALHGANGPIIVLVQSLVAKETCHVHEHVTVATIAKVITLTLLLVTPVHVLFGLNGVNSQPVRSHAAMVPKSVTEHVPVVLLATIVMVKCAKVSNAHSDLVRPGLSGHRSQRAVRHAAADQ